MNYITKAEMIARFGYTELTQLTDREDTGAIVDEVLDGAIADAGTTIDSYLQQSYTLPLSDAVIGASPLKRICGDLAMSYLYVNGPPEHIADNAKAAVQWLRDIAAGKATLGAQESDAADSPRITTAPGVGANYDWDAY